MQIENHDLYPTMFLIGHRIVENQSQQVGTVIVKGTFQDMDAPKALSSAEEQMPIFLKDVPFNVVRNSDFEGVDPDNNEIQFWQAIGGEVVSETSEWVGEEGKSARLIASSESARLTQTLTFDQSLGGRTFILSFYAKADAAVTVNGFRLQSGESGRSICHVSATLNSAFQRFISEPEAWPADETATEVEVILPGSSDPTNPVYFDRVQVEEAAIATRWDEDTVFRYEHDLAPFKPFADVIVLGAASPPDRPPDHPTGVWFAVVETSSGQQFEKRYDATGAPAAAQFPTKTVFGWFPRGQEPRLGEAGENLEQFDPTEKVLPDNFQNTFYNGYERLLSGTVPLPYLANGTQLAIRSERRPPPPEPVSFTVRLPASRPTATLTVLNGSNQEEEQNVPLVLDTVTIEPERDRYMVVWRGTWLFEEAFKERYIKLTVQGGP